MERQPGYVKKVFGLFVSNHIMSCPLSICQCSSKWDRVPASPSPTLPDYHCICQFLANSDILFYQAEDVHFTITLVSITHNKLTQQSISLFQ